MMLDIKDILLLNDFKTIKSKIISNNILNDENFDLVDHGIIKYENVPYFYGVEIDNIDHLKLEIYKSNFRIISRWLKFILNGCDIKIDDKEYPNSIFLFLNDNFIVELDLKNDTFYVNYDRIWSKIQSKFNYNIKKIKVLCNYILEQHFKSKDMLTIDRKEFLSKELEQHFKSKDMLTECFTRGDSNTLEQHFKSKDMSTLPFLIGGCKELEQHFKSKL
jgi:hypothetical protein